MTEEQHQFLKGRMKVACTSQPELRKLQRLLLKLGGTHLVPPFTPDQHLEAILSQGFIMRGPAVIHAGRPSECHQNVARLWKRRSKRPIALATGYALSEDGLWRQHSWALSRDASLETTVERLHYFGLLLQAADADRFAAENS